ncbi:uncharacterized protein LODBEIA_P60630 [Lodderomyces beijingensis]|uniref:DBF4-type domain-containing protein n=1 Tax=Lodderomyces beijingensis TaxID=1775926 RepID=A0ABP0ZV44_9ASCO
MECDKKDGTHDDKINKECDVLTKKFTSLNRPRQPLREANANIPTPSYKLRTAVTNTTASTAITKQGSPCKNHQSPQLGGRGSRYSPRKKSNWHARGESSRASSVRASDSDECPLKELHVQPKEATPVPQFLLKRASHSVGSQEQQPIAKPAEQAETAENFSKKRDRDSSGIADAVAKERDVKRKLDLEANTLDPEKRAELDKGGVQNRAEGEQNKEKEEEEEEEEEKLVDQSKNVHKSVVLSNKDVFGQPGIDDKEKKSPEKSERNEVQKPETINKSQLSKEINIIGNETHAAPIASFDDSTTASKLAAQCERPLKSRLLVAQQNQQRLKEKETLKMTRPEPTAKPQNSVLQELDLNQLDHSHHDKVEKVHKAQVQQQQQKTNGRLSGEELYQWQQSWKRIMRESVAFFEGQHDRRSAEYRRALKYLKYVGCEVAPFYANNVTIIISKRPYDDKTAYPPHDIFYNVSRSKVKVWNYDKLFRFMKNLGLTTTTSDEQAVNTRANTQTSLSTNKLYNLLKEEKIYGSADRDPNARRDDFHYFGKNYLYVYDLSQAVRPIAIKEWSNDYPTLNLTLDGKCPFMYDPSNENSENRKTKRRKNFEATKSHRMALKAASHNVITGVSMSVNGFTGTSTSTDKIEEDTLFDEVEFRQPLARNSSCMQSKTVENMASGYNGVSNALQFSMDSNLNSYVGAAGNGLGPIGSQVPSKNLNNLKRRIFMKRKTSERREKEHTPGYCENCRVKYDHFDDHINSNRHRNFACDDENFKDIDELIFSLRESKSLGHVTSNGDYV